LVKEAKELAGKRRTTFHALIELGLRVELDDLRVSKINKIQVVSVNITHREYSLPSLD
jgi:hypothetical protein